MTERYKAHRLGEAQRLLARRCKLWARVRLLDLKMAKDSLKGPSLNRK